MNESNKTSWADEERDPSTGITGKENGQGWMGCEGGRHVGHKWPCHFGSKTQRRRLGEAEICTEDIEATGLIHRANAKNAIILWIPNASEGAGKSASVVVVWQSQSRRGVEA